VPPKPELLMLSLLEISIRKIDFKYFLRLGQFLLGKRDKIMGLPELIQP
jgi:hypothetical protein